MSTEYRLSYTAVEIDEKLGKIDNLVSSVNGVLPDENGNVEITIPDSSNNIDMSKYVTKDEMPNTINAALEEAKASGEFDGDDGYSPTATVTQTADGASINITDKNGTTTATIVNGKDGSSTRNLLDNSDFEIAQAGYGGKHGDGEDYALYAADRWVQNDKTERSYSKTTHNGHGALKCTTDTRIQQNLYLIEGEVYTASVIVGNNKLIKTFTANKGSNGTSSLWVNYQSAGHYQFVIASIPANTVVSEPVLYHGEYTIDTLPEYQPKEDAVELLTCRKFARISKNKLYGYATSTAAYVDVILETPMRVIPSIATITSKGVVTAGGKELTVTGLTVTRSSENSVSVMASYAADSTVSGQFACLNDANFLLSADL